MESSRLLDPTAKSAPKCLWIDRNKSNDLPFQGFGYHIRDFVDNKDQASAYVKNNALMCKSGPRLRMYPDLQTQDPILFFKPELRYNTDGTDVDPALVINNPGVMTDVSVFGRSLDDRATGTENNITLTPSDNIYSYTDPVKSYQLQQARRMFQGQLIISAMPTHSAKGLCESSSSFSPDFVSIPENLYCDMDEKTLYGLCSDTQSSCCFDLGQTQLRTCSARQIRGMSGAGQHTGNESKEYTRIQRWGMDASD